MTPRTPLFLLCAVLPLSCGGGESKTSNPQSSTVMSAGGGPSIVEDAIEPLPNFAPPAANQTLYKIFVYDRKSQKPIARARVILLRNQPDALFMREPLVRDKILDGKTRSHGCFYSSAEADGTMKWALVTGQGFIPTLIEAGLATGGQVRETKIEVDLVPTCKFVIRAPNGDRANNALCSMKPDEDAVSNRPGLKANYGWTERTDDLGQLIFNREPGTYRLEFSMENGSHRWYERFTWTGQQDEPRQVTLPEQSQEKPW
jgi:hypothetical protein